VYMPPTQVPSGKHTTASVVSASASKLSWNTCSNRVATVSSSLEQRGQMVGSPVDPDETATMSQPSSRPPRQRSWSG
jgi:hypothetical protein